MTDSPNELWAKAQGILAEALELSGQTRETFVVDACQGDAELLEEVRSLISASEAAEGFFDGLAEKVADAAEAQVQESEPLEGRTIGHFEIRRLLGRGGMGEVYLALDQKLGREVALKMLPRALAAHPPSVARFRREARIVASLKHPNVASIHDVEEVGNRIFLVLEFVDGPTLGDLLERGPLSVPESLEIARQIAEALEAAHDRGIVHRDLKPTNVKVSVKGEVRVLDFGIAKAPEPRRAPGAYLDVSPATPIDMTGPGMVLGTAAYMSPEQARGKPIDTRSDVWAFGALLYELLTGKRAFTGEDSTQVVARILEATPDWSALPTETPLSVRALLERCLERNVRRRVQAIGEARIALEDALSGRDVPPPVEVVP